MAIQGDFELNSQGFSVVPDADKVKRFRRRTEQPFLEAETTSGQKDIESIRPHDSRVYYAPTGGLGIDRIPSDRSKEPALYRRFYDATCDTRFGITVLPLLEIDSTETGLEVIRDSALFKSNLWAIWEDNTSQDLLARKFVGSTTSWDAGGTVLSGNTKVGLSLIANKTHLLALFADQDDQIIYRSTDGATWVAATTQPTANMLVNNVTANEDIDAGLLAEVNGLAVVPLWDEDNSNIVFFSSEDAGDNWDSQQDIRAHQTKTLGPFTGGFGLDKIPALENNDPLLAQRFFDATCDIWPSGAFLPLLEQASTKDSSGVSGPSMIRAGIDFKGKYITLGEDDSTISNATLWNYLGASTTYDFSDTVKTDVTDEALGLDMINIGDRLVILYVFQNDHEVCFISTLGAGVTQATTDPTTGLLSDSVGRNEDIDAGLLEFIGGEVIAALWHETSLQITFYSSSNSAVDFTDETLNIASAGGPKGIAKFIGEDGVEKLLVGTEEGIWEVDVVPGTWTSRLIHPMPAHADNCRRMAIGPDGALWFSQGVSDSEVFQVFRLTVADSKYRVDPVAGSPHLRDGVAADMLGSVRRLVSSGGFMYAALGGGSGSTKARIIKHNGIGWVPVRKHGTANQAIHFLGVSSNDDANPRLHYSVRTSSTNEDHKFLAEPNAHPLSGVTIPRASSGTLSLPYIDGGDATEKADWYRVEVDVADLDTSTSGEYIAATHGVDKTARSTTSLGNFFSNVKSLDYAAATQGINDGVELTFNRDGGDTGQTPLLYSLAMDFNKPPDVFGKISSGGGPKGVAVLVRGGRELLYVGTREGIYEVDTLNAPWAIRKVVDLEPHDDNCRRMTTHENKIWFGLGVDNDTPAPIWTLDSSGNVDTAQGLDVDDGLTADSAGPVRWMKSGGGFLYVSTGGSDGTTSRTSRIFCHNGEGWHSVRKHTSTNEKLEWLELSSDDDNTPRLHYAVRTGTSVSNTKHLEHPNTNPSSGILIKRELNGIIDFPWIDGGMPSIDGIFLNAGIAAGDLSATNSDQFINMDFAKDGEARAANDLGDFLLATKALQWPKGANAGTGISTRELSARLNLIRDASVNTDTPKFRSLAIDYVKDPDTVESWRVTIDLVETARLQETGVENIITRLQTARDLGTLPTFSYGNSGTKFVKVFIPEWEEEVIEDASEGGVAAPNTAAIRKGKVEVTLEERI